MVVASYKDFVRFLFFLYSYDVPDDMSLLTQKCRNCLHVFSCVVCVYFLFSSGPTRSASIWRRLLKLLSSRCTCEWGSVWKLFSLDYMQVALGLTSRWKMSLVLWYPATVLRRFVSLRMPICSYVTYPTGQKSDIKGGCSMFYLVLF